MNRTGEMILTIIGALIYAFFAVVGGIMVWLFNNEAMWNQASEEINQQPELEMEMTAGDMNTMMQMFQGSGWFLIIISVIAIIVGIISAILIKGDKNPKVAGIILIVTAVLGAITVFGIFSGLFYLIAGIMCLARKAPESIQTSE